MRPPPHDCPPTSATHPQLAALATHGADAPSSLRLAIRPRTACRSQRCAVPSSVARAGAENGRMHNARRDGCAHGGRVAAYTVPLQRWWTEKADRRSEVRSVRIIAGTVQAREVDGRAADTPRLCAGTCAVGREKRELMYTGLPSEEDHKQKCECETSVECGGNPSSAKQS